MTYWNGENPLVAELTVLDLGLLSGAYAVANGGRSRNDQGDC